MDPVETLIREAGHLRRRLWATSQTWGARFDQLIGCLLAGQDVQGADGSGIGHGFAVIFLVSGVKNMPPIKGQPADEWMAAWKEAHPGAWHDQVKKLNADKSLPNSYGADIAAPIYSAAMKRTHNRRHDADDLVSDVYAKFLGRSYIREGESVSSAISYVQRAIHNLGIDEGEEKGREQSLTPDDPESKTVQHDVADAHSLDQLMEHHARLMVEEIFQDSKLKSALAHIHQDALQYLALTAQDYDDTEILGVNAKREVVGPPMLKHPLTKGGERMYPSAWNALKQKMFDAIRNHFKHGGEHEHEHREASYDYDRRASV
jgi:DNA-directed RNA polymerase specialized sigma24 family protein